MWLQQSPRNIEERAFQWLFKCNVNDERFEMEQ